MTTMLPTNDDEGPKALDLYTGAGSDYLRNIAVVSLASLAIGVTPKLVRLVLPLGWLVDLCFAFAFAGGYQITLLNIARGKSTTPKVFLENVKYFWIYFAADVIFWGIMVLGLLGFGVPSVFFGVRCSLYRCYIAADHCGPFEALKKSWYATNGNFWTMCGAYGMSVGTVVLVWLVLTQIGKALHVPQGFVAGFVSVFVASMLVMLECKIFVILHDQATELDVDVAPHAVPGIELRSDKEL